MRDQRVLEIARVVLRFALGVTFLVSIADRFGLLGPYGAKNVSWGDGEVLIVKSEKMLRTALWLIVVGQLMGTVADSLNRTLVEMPAWRQLGAQAWATFSRRADLGNGEVLYPLIGIGGTVLILAAAIVFRLGARRPLSASIPLYGAALMAICVMLTTTQAAPIMLSLHRIGSDPAALQQAFEGFYRWDSIRAVFGAVGGCAEILALVGLAALAFDKNTPPQE